MKKSDKRGEGLTINEIEWVGEMIDESLAARDARIVELEAERDALNPWATLGMACLARSPENDCDPISGGALQQLAIDLGLLEYATVGEPCGDRCQCADYYGPNKWPAQCLRLSALGKTLP